MKKVYIASPYTLGDVAVNVKTQMDMADKLMDLGFVPFVPLYSHFQHMAHPRPYKDWIALDLEWVEICDYVLRLPGESSGADGEVRHAEKLNIPIFYSLEELLNTKKMKYKIAYPHEYLFNGGKMTELMILKHLKKKGLADNTGVYVMTSHLLEEYGIFLMGGTKIGDYDVRYMSINKDFPIENEFLFTELYNFSNAKINIGLLVGAENCAYSFFYDLDTKKVRLVKHIYGTEEASIDFDSFPEFFELIKTCDYVNKLELLTV